MRGTRWIGAPLLAVLQAFDQVSLGLGGRSRQRAGQPHIAALHLPARSRDLLDVESVVIH